MSTIFVLEIKGAKINNNMPYRHDFWRVFREHCEASKKYNFIRSVIKRPTSTTSGQTSTTSGQTNTTSGKKSTTS